MKVTRIQATSHRVPITVPLLSEPIHREFVFVRLQTDSGATGYGLTGPVQRSGVREFINKEIAPLLAGADPLATERIWHDLFYRLNPRVQTGVWSSGVSAVDIALWDLKGKLLGQPVWRLLGGYNRTVEAYVTFGLAEYDRDQLVEAAKLFVKQGHDKLKMVVGAGPRKDPVEDAARVRMVREAVGERVDLMVDANYMLSFPQARDLCHRIEPYRITWFEEPVYGNDARLLASLRRQTRIPIAAGQNEGHKWRHRELLVNEAIDIAQPNVVWVGGYTEAVKVAAMAQSFNVPIANGGGWPHHNMHLIAGVANGWRVEFHLLMWLTGEMIYRHAPSPADGMVTLTEQPGLGLEPQEEVLRDTEER
ncbi:MAG TPA: mandelate racemase/muconate lactonizing enzyme family protein [Methylomirabilota bacterium]|jgi:L-alanine-DL-glutamate epimerase-like enolase superfamily enzyme|nr:mandelate racemase/muconate lactonizing enzyme family protein [Methylomirabilota bacterium]